MTKPCWEKRIQRAEELAQAHPFAAEMLRFYREVAQLQKSLCRDLESACGSGIRQHRRAWLRDELPVELLLPGMELLFAIVKRAGPARLSDTAAKLAGESQARWSDLLLTDWWADAQLPRKSQYPEAFFAQVILGAYAEYLVDHTEVRTLTSATANCPVCERRPQVGVLRAEGDGGKRSLVCSLCAWEWDFRRIVCPACGEDDPRNLPVYTADQFGHVRIEACEACRTYIKTVDLTKNGLAVPVVDELATTPLNLWAQSQGYAKLQLNLLGI